MFGLSWIRVAIYAAIALAVMAAVTWAVRTYNESLREEGRAEVLAQWNEATRLAQKAEDNRDAERRAKNQEDADEVSRDTRLLAARAATARDAAERLRDDESRFIAAARAQGACGAAAGRLPSVQGAGASAVPGEQPDAIEVIAELRGRFDRAAGEFAGYADALRAAGESCERRYDAVKDTQ